LRFMNIVAGLLCLLATPLWANISLDVSHGHRGGTLLLPDGDGPWPVVLILADSSLPQLAEGLADQGVASLSTDKLGAAGSASNARPEKNMQLSSFIDDAVHWTNWLQGDNRFSSVSIAGHSQGSQVGMSAAWLAGADGFAILADPGRQDQNSQQMINRLSCPVTIVQGLSVLQASEQDAVGAVVALTAKAEIFHRQWNAALDRAAQYNTLSLPPGEYGLGSDYSTCSIEEKISRWIGFSSRQSHGYRFGLAEEGYVTEGKLFMNGHYDCVSFMYRCTELARATSERDNLAWALRTRFAGAHPDSVVGPDGRVDYDRPEHLDFSLDMIRSGIWGRDISAEVGRLEVDDVGSLRYPAGSFSWVPARDLNHARLQIGDIVWFVLNPENKKARKLRDEYGLVVGHLGLMQEHEGQLVLVHAASSDLDGVYEGGQVVMVDLAIYLQRVDRYAGVFVTRP